MSPLLMQSATGNMSTSSSLLLSTDGSPILSGLLEGLIAIKSSAQAYSYLQVASLTILFYDFILTFSREVDFIRKSRQWTLVSILHFVIRMFPYADNGLIIALTFAPNTHPKECKTWITAQAWIFFVEYFAVECMHIIRTYAIWGNNRKIGIILFTLLALLAISCGILIKFYLDPFKFVDDVGPLKFQGCFPSLDFVNLLWIVYLLLLVHESAVLSLTLIKTLRHKRYDASSLFRTIFFDGISFYMFISAMSITNIVIFTRTDLKSQIMSFGLAALHRNLNAILCIRLMFNIRRAADQGELKQIKRAAVERGILIEREVVITQDCDLSVDQPECGVHNFEFRFIKGATGEPNPAL